MVALYKAMVHAVEDKAFHYQPTLQNLYIGRL